MVLKDQKIYGNGTPSNFTQRCVCSEVEIDILSGNHSATKPNFLVDIGHSIILSLEIGQILRDRKRTHVRSTRNTTVTIKIYS